MLMLCTYVFASVVATMPVQTSCVRVTAKQAEAHVFACKLLDKDPLATCESQRMGALTWFIRVRRLEVV
jgi:hypothetical protein